MTGWLIIALGIVCFAIGAACVIEAIALAFFVSASEAVTPVVFGACGVLLLGFAFLFLRRVRGHND